MFASKGDTVEEWEKLLEARGRIKGKRESCRAFADIDCQSFSLSFVFTYMVNNMRAMLASGLPLPALCCRSRTALGVV